MDSHSNILFAEDRKRRIVEIVQQQGNATVAALCEEFGVSPGTIRNDLRELEDGGVLRRTHGGAIKRHTLGFEMTTHEKEVRNVEQKRAIAREAVRFVCPGDTIAIDTGTTTFELAKLLPGIEGLTVVTNDLQIASYLEQHSDALIVMAGGVLRRNFHCTAGEYAVAGIRSLHVDKLFIAANGVHMRNGLTTYNMEIAAFKKQLIEIADKVFLLVDSTKLNMSALISFADMGRVDMLITDCGAEEAFLDAAQQSGLTAICARAQNENNQQ